MGTSVVSVKYTFTTKLYFWVIFKCTARLKQKLVDPPVFKLCFCNKCAHPTHKMKGSVPAMNTKKVIIKQN